MNEKLEQLEELLKAKLIEINDDVDEAYDDREGLYDDRMYDFGHPQDSFDAGWDRGETVAEFDTIKNVLTMIEELKNK